MSQGTIDILTNRNVIAIDQDPAAHPVRRTVSTEGKTELWTRQLQDGSEALDLFNRSDQPAPVRVVWSQIGMKAPITGRNLWTHEDVPLSGDTYTPTIAKHGVVILRIPKS
jgi:alpha-galactosidase